uniref:Zn-finger protein n=1 Tax=Pithovirus LCPAC403 TaxID=2506596 RepID=A0A481ZE10_9VIRU|nr:MAG: Zn-finger protein [Pithovirus LCPAC403]
MRDFHIQLGCKGGVINECKVCRNSRWKAINHPRKESGDKICTICKKTRDVSYFGAYRRNIDGLSNHCKECYNDKHNFARQTTGDRTCIRCNVRKPVDKFWANPGNESGLKVTCIQCYSIRRVESSSELKNFIHTKYLQSKRSKHGCDVSEDYVKNLWNEQEHICSGTGYEIRHEMVLPDTEGFRRIPLPHYFNLSIDRIDSSIGYVENNIQLVTLGYNYIKNKLDEDFLFVMARYIAEYKGITKKIKISSIVEKFIRVRLNCTLDRVQRRTRKGIKLDITLNELYTKFENQGGLCMLSGLPMTTYTTNRFRPLEERKQRLEKNYHNISIDRIDSFKDYTIDNVNLVCSCINIMKSEMPQDMFIDFCKAIANTHPDK